VHTFSNRYHFSGGTPADATHWTTLSDAIVTAEKAIYEAIASGGAKIIATVGYDAGSEVPVFNKTYTTDGTGVFGAWVPLPGDTAGLVRYSTSDRSSKNHPIYCFNYYHTCGVAPGALLGDTLNAAQSTALSTYAASWITGFSDGSSTKHRSRPNGNACTGALVEPLITHRDLPR
jgi:hypothetical protein